MDVKETLGKGLGAAVSGLAYWGSSLRHARVFHPQGDLYLAKIKSTPADPSLEGLAQSLAGEALVRFSGGLWRDEKKSFDVLGCAIRFAWSPAKGESEANVQDLLLGTFKSVLTLPLAPLTTHTDDYLRNTYYSASSFTVDSLGKLEFRLVPLHKGVGHGHRREKLQKAVEQGCALWRLETRATGLTSSWKHLAELNVAEHLDLSDEPIHFSPFHDSLGIHPTGFINSIRKLAYAGSQAGREH